MNAADKLTRAVEAMRKPPTCPGCTARRSEYRMNVEPAIVVAKDCRDCARLVVLAVARALLAEPSGAAAIATEESIRDEAERYADRLPNGRHVLVAAFAAELAALETP